jgi:hypothetical protein
MDTPTRPCLERAKDIWKLRKIWTKWTFGSLHLQQKPLHRAVVVEEEKSA